MLAEYPFSLNTFTIAGHKMNYLDEGEGPVVVLVHGNPTWSYYYRNLVLELRKNHRVIVPDHIGCGLSDKPQQYSYTLSQHISNLSSLLSSLELTEYSLVVHDWGGAIGMGCAVKNPDQLRKIVVLNSAAFRSSRIPFRISVCRWPILGPLIVRGLNGFARPATFMAVNVPLKEDVKKGYLHPYNSWASRVAVSAFVQDIPLKPSHQSYDTLVEVENGLQGIAEAKIPMLILWGGKDFCFNDHFYDEWLDRFPAADHYYFQNGGHYILEDKAEVIIPQISEFLRTEMEK
ncbi:alpha/beta fold hydrolase [Desulfopila sp. IMCC35008]|uniref:alpha/beta fold hydrolase n=1 Tax=Desulfopila sp. IMCC35008 TaxID=2653858 RepID=UPI001F10D467|nr:alpha/beta fold hydrolase [Desulfopila sp. IMCC35008]